MEAHKRGVADQVEDAVDVLHGTAILDGGRIASRVTLHTGPMRGDAGGLRRASQGARAQVTGYAMLQGYAVDRAGAMVLARDESSGRRVVIRVLSPAITADARSMRRLRHDLTSLMLLRDPNVVAVLGFDAGAHAVIYESITGTTLRQVLQRGALETAAALVLLDDCLVALTALHRAGVLHRDVHPECIVIDRSGTASLRDAGVPVPPLHAGWRAGTPQYMAPELWDGRDHTDVSDVYATSCVAVEALTGEPAFASQDIAALRRAHLAGRAGFGSMSEGLRALLARGLAVDPEERSGTGPLRSELGATAAAELGEGWRAAGRAALARAAVREPEAAASPQPVAEQQLDSAVA
ncbi:MAG TPA: serine/threonine-protein kinase, partial [Candidatus Dormibacteraeota bacterium]|nr:serine/threonine-protein kinase [Candidatus Dormibacteraeota bacterium]